MVEITAFQSVSLDTHLFSYIEESSWMFWPIDTAF